MVRRRSNVVSNEQATRVDPLATKPLCCLPKVQDVPGVVAESNEEPGATISGFAHCISLGGRGRGEDVPAHSTISEARTDPTCKGRVMSRSPTDDEGNLAIGTGSANNSPEYRPQMVRESADKPRDRLRWEIIGIIHKSGHIWVPCHHRRWCFPHVS